MRCPKSNIQGFAFWMMVQHKIDLIFKVIMQFWTTHVNSVANIFAKFINTAYLGYLSYFWLLGYVFCWGCGFQDWLGKRWLLLWCWGWKLVFVQMRPWWFRMIFQFLDVWERVHTLWAFVIAPQSLTFCHTLIAAMISRYSWMSTLKILIASKRSTIRDPATSRALTIDMIPYRYVETVLEAFFKFSNRSCKLKMWV